MIYSGLDWSGSPGRRGDSQIVFAVAHVDGQEVAALDRVLAELRSQLRVPSTFVFRHAGASQRTQDLFFTALPRMPIRAHAYVMDSAAWASPFSTWPDGNQQLCHGIIELVLGCPDAVVAGQILYIDLPATEESRLVSYRTTLRKALQGAWRTGFRNVRPCPDHRLQGAIVQVADMIAGEINEQSGLAGPYRIALQSRVRLV